MAEVIKTIKPTAGDYATLSAWEAGEQRALASGEVAVAECYMFAGGLNNQCTFDGWTFADATSRIVVRAATGNRHNGVAGAGFYLTRAAVVVSVTVAASHNVDFEYLEIDGAGYSGDLIRISAATINSNAAGLILHDASTSYAVSGATSNVGVWSNVISYNCGRGYNSGGTSGLVANNWTVYGGAYGILRAKTINCGCFGQTTTCFLQPAAGSDYNVSSDATAPGTNKATGKTAYTDYFVDPANGDFHLKDTSLNLFGLSGTDLSATFTTDIDGVIRTFPFDIGADQYVAAGGGSFTGTYAAIQAIQQQSIISALSFSGISSQIQAANTEALAAILSFSGEIGQIQAIQAQAIFQALLITGVIEQSQAAQIASLTAALSFSGSLDQSQNAQIEALASVLSFAGATQQAQEAQTEALQGLLSFGGNVTQTQIIQIETLTAILAFSGGIEQTQEQQRQLILEFIAAIVFGFGFKLQPEVKGYVLPRETRGFKLPVENRGYKV